MNVRLSSAFLRPSKLRLPAAAVLLALSMLVLLSRQDGAPTALANFHIAHIDEIMSGAAGNPNIQYVEVQQDLGGQNVVDGSTLTLFQNGLPGGFQVLAAIPTDVNSTTSGSRWIMASPDAATFLAASGINPDFTFTATPSFGATGMICWGKPFMTADPNGYVDCVAYGGYTGPVGVPFSSGTATMLPPGDGTLSLTRKSNTSMDINDFELRCPTPTDDPLGPAAPPHGTGSFGACALPTLNVIKQVTNDNGGTKAPSDFSMHVKRSGTDVAGSPQAGTVTGTTYTLTPTGTYTVSEDAVAGYSATFSGDCNASGVVTLAVNDVKTCTVTNNDIQPSVTVKKTVLNDNSGVAVPANFQMHVKNGGLDVAGSPQAGTVAGTTYNLNAGTYTVSEDPFGGYTPAFSGGCSGSGVVVLVVGDVKTCNVLNDDPCTPDSDGDGACDAIDNCVSTPNASQANTDSGPPPPAGNIGVVDNGPGLTGNDSSLPNGDTNGDACDLDRDNDGLPDAEDTEPLTGAGLCGALTTSDAHPNPAFGDITNDDNGDGIPGNMTDNGPSWDTDNDGILDGVECQLGSNPRLASSKPSAATCGGNTDADNDGLVASAERCKWGTSDTNTETDGDGKKDCVEANDTNGDGVSNFPGDTVNSAKAANNIIGKTMDFDLNGDGVTNFPGDTILSAKIVNHVSGIC